METANTAQKMHWLPAAIALVQLFDIVIHVANGMIEPIRIASNLFIFIWLGIVVSGQLKHIQPARLATSFMGIYLLLNVIFLATEGLTNPDNGDAFRTTLFVLVGITVALSVWLANMVANRTG